MRPQEKFFDLLKRAASPHNLQLVTSFSYSNMGVLYLQRPGSFETAIELPFDFQTARASFGWQTSKQDERPRVFPNRSNPHFALFAYSELDEAIAAIIAFAKANAPQ